jgi:hypothetical protein
MLLTTYRLRARLAQFLIPAIVRADGTGRSHGWIDVVINLCTAGRGVYRRLPQIDM